MTMSTVMIENRSELFSSLLEYTAAGVSKIDRAANVMRGVKILGTISKNNRVYTREAMRSAVQKYANSVVNVNHDKASGVRGYEDRIGRLQNVRFQDDASGGGLYADFHYNPHHKLANQLLHDAEHSPQNVGFSHNAKGRTRRDSSGRVVVEEIADVISVDLVADPATVNGLFESVDVPSTPESFVESITAGKPLPEGAAEGFAASITQKPGFVPLSEGSKLSR
jgi:hypothetical protein